VRPYLLNIAVIEQDLNPQPIASTAFAVLDGAGLVEPRYLWTVLRSPYFVEGVEDKMRGLAYPAINDSDFSQLPVPLPPLAEQRRIVGKVDELMTLCDQLELAQKEREMQRDVLRSVSLYRLAATDEDAVTEASVRCFLDTSPRLSTKPNHVAPIRQAILDLAVRGRLVPQDVGDEPAAELLLRLRSSANGSVAGYAKSQSGPFHLPAGWEWVRFPELGKFGRGKSKHRPRNDPVLYAGGLHPFIQTGDVARSGGLIRTFNTLYNDTGLAQSQMWPAGTLCITIAANIADSGVLTFDACFPDSVVGLIVSSEFTNCRYFEYFLRTAKADLHSFAPSTAQKNINLSILGDVMIPLPPLEELN
jgi:type I restriction enzyme S subunit